MATVSGLEQIMGGSLYQVFTERYYALIKSDNYPKGCEDSLLVYVKQLTSWYRDNKSAMDSYVSSNLNNNYVGVWLELKAMFIDNDDLFLVIGLLKTLDANKYPLLAAQSTCKDVYSLWLQTKVASA